MHFMRKRARVTSPRANEQMVAALIRTVFAQESEAEARRQWRAVADQLREASRRSGR